MEEIQKNNLTRDLCSVLERYGQTSAFIIVKDPKEVNTIDLIGSNEQNPEFIKNLGIHVNATLNEHLLNSKKIIGHE